MKTLIIVLALALTPSAHAVDFFIDLGVGFTHPDLSGAPEIDMPAPLAKGSIGFITEYDYEISIEHISSIGHKDVGKGLNVLWVSKRFSF